MMLIDGRPEAAVSLNLRRLFQRKRVVINR
jgi:hypothetical protein